jgi:hypothetical protein
MNSVEGDRENSRGFELLRRQVTAVFTVHCQSESHMSPWCSVMRGPVSARWTRHPGEATRLTRRCVFSVQLFNLLLHLAAKFQWMRDLVKWLGSPARPDHNNRSVTQHPAERRLVHFDAFHFV